MDNSLFFRNIFFKKINFYFIFIPILAILASGCSSLKNENDKWFAKDKLYHFAAAGAVSAAVTSTAKNNGASDGRAAIAGVSVTLTLGAGKETYDKKVKKTFFSWKDMFWNLLGAITGSLIINISD